MNTKPVQIATEVHALIKDAGLPIASTIERLIVKANCKHPETQRMPCQIKVMPGGGLKAPVHEFHAFYCKDCGRFVTDAMEAF